MGSSLKGEITKARHFIKCFNSLLLDNVSIRLCYLYLNEYFKRRVKFQHSHVLTEKTRQFYLGAWYRKSMGWGWRVGAMLLKATIVCLIQWSETICKAIVLDGLVVWNLLNDIFNVICLDACTRKRHFALCLGYLHRKALLGVAVSCKQ